MAVYGTWLLTESDPSGIGEDQYGRVRKIMRLALAVGLSISLLTIVRHSVAITGASLSLIQRAIDADGWIIVVAEIAKFFYLEKLAMRIPDRQMADRARLIRRAYVLLGAAMIVVVSCLGLLSLLTRAGQLGFLIFTLLLCIAALVLFVMALRLQWRLRNAFREQAGFARDTWARAQGTVAGES